MAADRREFELSIISDASRFDLDKPAKGLADLGRSAKDAERDIDATTDKIERSVDRLGATAQDTAAQVDSAFEKIAASSRSNLRKVDADADRAKKGLDDFKDEAHSSGREAAASFSGGFDDIGDFIQETAANAFAGFGKLGGAAGIAAAVGIGFVMNSINEANEKIKELRSSWQSIFENADTTALDKRTQAIKDIESAGVNLEDLKRNLDAAGVSVNDYISAYVNGGPTLDRVNAALREQNSQYGGFASLIPGLSKDAGFYYDILNNGRTAIEGETDAQKVRNEALGQSAKALDDYNAVSDDAVSKAKDLVAAHDTTAEAIKTVATADDEVTQKISENGQVKIDAITNVLKEQTKAARSFAKNLQSVQQQGDDEFTAWISSQGPEMAQAWVSGSKAQRSALYNAWKANVGAQMGKGTAAGLTGEQTTIRDAAGNLYAVAKDALGDPIVIPVHTALVTRGPGSVAAAEEQARRSVRPIAIPAYVDVPNARKWQGG